jgi:hypothetical protein
VIRHRRCSTVATTVASAVATASLASVVPTRRAERRQSPAASWLRRWRRLPAPPDWAALFAAPLSLGEGESDPPFLAPSRPALRVCRRPQAGRGRSPLRPGVPNATASAASGRTPTSRRSATISTPIFGPRSAPSRRVASLRPRARLAALTAPRRSPHPRLPDGRGDGCTATIHVLS